MSKLKIIFSSIILFLLSWTAAFAEVSIETSVSRSQLAVGEELTLDIIVSNADGSISQPTLPPIQGFSSYSQGHSQEISIINGKSSSQSIYSYVLIANEVGKKIIGPFEIKIGNKVFKVAPVEVEVTSDNPSAGANQPNAGFAQGPVVAPPPRAMPKDGITNQDIFVKTWLDKDDAFINEPVMLTYTIYTRLSAAYKGFEKEPVTTGFWVEDFPPDKTIRRTEQVLNGSRYVVADIRKMALFPTQAGVFTIDTGTVGTTVEIQNEQGFNSFFSSNIFGRQSPFPQSQFFSQVVSKMIPTDKVTLVVKALPEADKPAMFNGAVGDYRIESSIDKSEVEVGTPITFKVRISGEGNINTVQTPALPKMENFKIYDSSNSVNISKNRLVVEGEKVTETVLVPRKAGHFTIPQIEFSFYDYKANTYKTLQTSPHTLSVKPGSEPEETPTGSGVESVEQEDVSLTGRDIRYIKTIEDPNARARKPFYKSPFYWGLNVLLFLASVLFMFLASNRVDTRKAGQASRSRTSHRVAKAKLKKAAHFMKKDKAAEFFNEISKAVYGYFADKLGVSSQAVNVALIEQYVSDEIAPEILNQIKALFDALSMGRFAPTQTGDEEIKRIYQMADAVITNFEKVKLK